MNFKSKMIMKTIKLVTEGIYLMGYNEKNEACCYYPLSKEVKELDLPMLPNPFKGEDDVNKLAKKVFEEKTSRIPVPTSFWLREVSNYEEFWKEGYKASQSKQLELLKRAIQLASDAENIEEVEREIIQTLSTQQLPVSFEPEYINN